MGARPRLWVILLTVFVDLLGFGLVIPVGPYYATAYGATETQVALLTGAYSLPQLFLVPFWGRLSDRWGRRPTMLLSIAGTTVAMALFGWAPSLLWLFVARFAHGAMTANVAIASAYLADITESKDRAKGMGLIGAAFGLGFIVGPLVGGLLGSLGTRLGIGYGLVGYGGAALSLLNLTFAYFFLVEPKRTVAAIQETFFDALGRLRRVPEVGVLLVISFLSVFAFANMTATYALLTMTRLGWTDDSGAAFNGYMFTLIGIISAVIQGGLIGRLTARFGEKKLVKIGMGSMAIGLALLGLVHSVGFLIAASCFTAVGSSLSNAPLNPIISVRTPEDLQGSMFGITRSTGSLGRLLGPVFGGLLFEYSGSGTPFFFGAAVMAMTGMLFWARVRSPHTAVTS